ncbi:MAG: biopolymer transporter ExbD [Pirellulales bacterium]|nr:biopolymer transporter ExbD [Pirellulales bacterium]
MKIDKGGGDFQKIEINMTPMIDACFQLIIFFMLSLRVFSPEGDFGITMPIASTRPSDISPSSSAVVKIRLAAHPNGNLAGITMGDRKLSSFAQLHNQIREISGLDSGGPAGAGGAEVELDCDYNLKYEYVVDALNAVSGYVANDKQTIIRMIEKIRFGRPRDPPPEENQGAAQEGAKQEAAGEKN